MRKFNIDIFTSQELISLCLQIDSIDIFGLVQFGKSKCIILIMLHKTFSNNI